MSSSQSPTFQFSTKSLTLFFAYEFTEFFLDRLWIEIQEALQCDFLEPDSRFDSRETTKEFDEKIVYGLETYSELVGVDIHENQVDEFVFFTVDIKMLKRLYSKN